jgi:hypothetical protein
MKGGVLATAPRIDYAELDDEWGVDVEAGVYTSQFYEGYQRLIFNEPFRDGNVSAEITVLEKESEDGRAPKVGAIVFRFQDPNNYYYASIGGFDGRFFS